jgi:hypothetical protein
VSPEVVLGGLVLLGIGGLGAVGLAVLGGKILAGGGGAKAPVDEARRAAARAAQIRLEEEARAARQSASYWDYLTKGAEVVQGGADLAVDVIGSVTGPVGANLKIGYQVVKGGAEGLGGAIADGGNAAEAVAKGLGKGAVDALTGVALDKAGGVLKAGTGLDLPGFVDLAPDVDWSKLPVESVGKRLLDGLDPARDQLATAVQGSVQSKIQDLFLGQIGLKP